MFEYQLETIKYATFNLFGWIFQIIEWITSVFYETVFGVSVILIALIAIILFLIINFTIADMSSAEKSPMFGGRKKKLK